MLTGSACRRGGALLSVGGKGSCVHPANVAPACRSDWYDGCALWLMPVMDGSGDCFYRSDAEDMSPAD